MSRLALYLLGPPHFELSDAKIHLDRRKAVALLAYLAMTGQEHRRDTLATLLWPELDQQRARAGLRRTLVALRGALGQGWLGSDRETVRLQPDAPLWIDVAQFRDRLAACETHEHPANASCPDCLPLLEAAVALYRDDFMAGFTLRDSLAFDEWQFFQTEELRQALALALERLAWGYASQAEYDRALRYARRWVGLDPLHEPAQRELIALYARAGQTTAALRQYQLCEQSLAEELGASPTEETRTLYERIRGGTMLEPEHVSPVAVPHSLPSQPTPFVGREEELARIAERLADPACRLLTLVGPGGIGKTRLAIQAAERAVESLGDTADFPHGVYFAPLVAAGSVDAVVHAVAHAISLSFYGQGETREQLLGYLREKQMLLVLDNLEHLLGEIGLLSEILAAAPALKILVTSREALNLQGEWLQPVDGLRYPGGVDLKDEQATLSFGDYEAVVLFLNSARRANPDFVCAEGDHWVARICELVEGIPLAIEMAAAWLKALTPAQVAAEIEQGLDILSTSWRDLPARHSSMRAVFNYSWELLVESERAVLRKLSVFRGSFATQAAREIAGGSLFTLVALVEKSLLQSAPKGRYQMHELLRQYAAEKLGAHPEEEEGTREQHSAHYAAFLRERGEMLKGGQQQSALAEIEADIGNGRAAWNWAVTHGHAERLEEALEGLCHFYVWRNLWEEGESACREAAERLASATLGVELRVLATSLAWASVFNVPFGRAGRARQLAEQSLAVLDRPGLVSTDTRSTKAFALRQLAEVSLEMEAQKLHEQSLALYQTLGDRWGSANALPSVGRIARFLGAYDKAEKLLQESLEIRRVLDDRRGMAFALHGLAAIAMRLGQLEKSEGLLRQGIKIRQEINDRWGAAAGLGVLGEIYSLQGKYAEAAAMMEQCIGKLKDLGVHGAVAWWNIKLGLVKAHLGRYEEASAHGQAARDFYQGIGWLWAGHLSLCLLGWVALARQDWSSAQGLFRESVTKSGAEGARDELAPLHAWLGYACLRSGDLQRAAGHLCAALRTASEIRSPFQLLETLSALAPFLSVRGDVERAIELYALVSHHPFVANSRWFEDMIGGHMAAVAATLAPELVAAAQERGRVRDLWETAAELVEELENTNQD